TPSPSSQKGINLYSIEKEAALGRKLAAEYREHTTAIASPSVQQYVETLRERLASKMTNAAYTFSVVSEDPCPIIHEPVALPGGYIFVPSALFLAAQDEAEFAGMMVHAIAHIFERHGTQQATRGELAGVPVAFVGGGAGCSSSGALPLLFRNVQRTFELQADLLAIQILARAGYDPNALVRYIERVQPGVSTSPAVFSSMPPREERIAGMLSAIANLPPTNYAS